MADNTTLDPGTGGDTIATDDVAGVKYQRVKLVDGTADSTAVIPGDASNGLDVDVTRVQGSVAVTNAGTFAVQADTELTTADLDSGAGTDTRAVVGLVIAKSGGAANISNSDPVPVSDAGGTLSIDDGAGSITVDGTVSITANSAVNLAQVAGTTTDTNSGVKSAGTQRVVLATDQPALTNALKVDGSAVTQPVSGTVTINTIPAGNNNIGDVDIASIAAGNNNIGDVDVASIAAGTATIGAVNVKPTTSGGLTTSHLASAATTNATNVKASAGQLFGWYIYNSNAAARKIAFHNNAGTPTAGASVVFSLVIPPTSAANVELTNGIAFSTGIAFTTVTGLADSDTTAVAANDLIINLWYA